MTTTEPSVVTFDDALRAIRALRLEIAELRGELTAALDGLAEQVTTRRLVVADANGREAIYTAVDEDGAELYVFTEHDGVEHLAAVQAIYSGSCDGVLTGLYIDVDGTKVGSLVASSGHSVPAVGKVAGVDVELILPNRRISDPVVAADGSVWS